MICVDWIFYFLLGKYSKMFFFNVEFVCSVDKSCYYTFVTTFFPYFHTFRHSYISEVERIIV